MPPFVCASSFTSECLRAHSNEYSKRKWCTNKFWRMDKVILVLVCKQVIFWQEIAVI